MFYLGDVNVEVIVMVIGDWLLRGTRFYTTRLLNQVVSVTTYDEIETNLVEFFCSK